MGSTFRAEDVLFLDALNGKRTVFLARHSATGLILAGRQLSKEQTEPYQKLLGKRIPHIPQVRCVRQDTPELYMEFEDYIPGLTLEHILENGHLMAPADAARIGAQLCDALTALHGLGLVHRDVKPSNVIVTEEGEAYLIDFDISRVEKPQKCRDTATLGTMGFAAPEQFGFQQTDCRADIYAMGALLNMMTTGQLPQQQKAEGALGKVISKCVCIDPQGRYASAAELKKALQLFLLRCGGYPLPKKRAKSLPHLVKGFIGSLPGFRTHNIVAEMVAVIFYCAAALLTALLISAGLESLSNFAVAVFLLALAYGWFFFAFDCFGLRSRYKTLEKHRKERMYPIYCGLVMLLWLLVLFTLLGIFLGILGEERPA